MTGNFGKEYQDIFIEVIARNDEFDIRSYYTFIGLSAAKITTDNVKMYRSDNNGTIDFGSIEASNTHRAVHLAYNAWKFCKNNNVHLNNGLSIRIQNNFKSAFFLPNKINGLNSAVLAGLFAAQYGGPLVGLGTGLATSIIFRNPHIFVRESDLESESSIYHEFGHFVMWNVQNTKWVDLGTGSFASHGRKREANSRIAWTEGWADGFMNMVDAYYQNDDNEYGLDNALNFDNRLRDNTYSFNNGIHSEYNVACALFDFWDGDFLNQNSYNQWDDFGQDYLDIPFEVLTKPMEGLGVIDNFGDYFNSLTTILINPIDKSEAGNILRLNHLTADASNYNFFTSNNLPFHNNDHGHGNLATQEFFKKDVTFYNSGAYFQTTHAISYFNQPADNVITSNGGVFTDAISVGFDFQNLFIRSNSNIKNQLRFVRRANITVFNGGNLIIGNDNGTNPCELAISDQAYLQFRTGGKMTIKSGSSLRIAEGSTFKTDGNVHIIVEDGAKIIIDEGAYLCLSNSTTFDFQGGFDDLELNPHHKSVSEFSKLKIGVNALNSDGCYSFEDLYSYNYNVNLVQNRPLDCTTGHFEFEITNIQSLPYDAQICWSFPEHWTVNSFTNCSRWAYPIGGSVNSWGNSDFIGGEVKVVITSSLGIQELSYTIANKPTPTITSNKGNELTICQDNSQGDLIISASNPNSSSNFTFQWSNQWGLNHQIINTSTTSTMRFNTPQWSVDPQYVSVTATNDDGCVSDPLNITIKPKVNGWIASRMWTKNTNQYQALNTTNKKANIISEKKGNIYYVGNDNKIYTYTYDNSFGAWRNYALPKTNPIQDAAGPLLMIEPIGGERTIYYVTTSGDIHVLEASNSSTDFITNSSLNINSSIVNPESSVLSWSINQNGGRDIIYTNGSNVRNGQGVLLSYNNSALAFGGNNIIHRDGFLYFRSTNGKMNAFNYISQNLMQFNNQTIDAQSDLAIDDYGNIWFTKWSQMNYFDTQNNAFNGVNAYNSSGKISINKETGVVYFVDSQNRFAQIYFNAGINNWDTNVIGLSNSSTGGTSIMFSNPNLFFTNSSGYIWDLFYFIIDCSPAIFRADLEALKNPEAYLEVGEYRGSQESKFSNGSINLYPNPVQGNVFNLDYTLNNTAIVDISILDMQGKLIKRLQNSNEESGDYQKTFEVNVSPGVYLLNFSQNGSKSQTLKLVVTK